MHVLVLVNFGKEDVISVKHQGVQDEVSIGKWKKHESPLVNSMLGDSKLQLFVSCAFFWALSLRASDRDLNVSGGCHKMWSAENRKLILTSRSADPVSLRSAGLSCLRLLVATHVDWPNFVKQWTFETFETGNSWCVAVSVHTGIKVLMEYHSHSLQAIRIWFFTTDGQSSCR